MVEITRYNERSIRVVCLLLADRVVAEDTAAKDRMASDRTEQSRLCSVLVIS